MFHEWRNEFEDYKKCLQNNKMVLRLQQIFRSKLCIVLTEEVNKVVLSVNGDKRLPMLDEMI